MDVLEYGVDEFRELLKSRAIIGSGDHKDVETPLGTVRLCPGSWFGTVYVFAIVPAREINAQPPQVTYGIPVVPERGRDLLLATRDGGDLVELNAEDARWRPLVVDLEDFVKPLMRPWSDYYPQKFLRVLAGELEESASLLMAGEPEGTERAVAAWSGSIREFREIEPQRRALLGRMQQIGWTSPKPGLRKGRLRTSAETSRGAVTLEVRVLQRVTIVFVAEDESVRAALDPLVRQWWHYWNERLGKTLGWWQVGTGFEIEGRGDRSSRRSALPLPEVVAFPPVWPEDPEVERVFLQLESVLLLAAAELVIPRVEAAERAVATGAEGLSEEARRAGRMRYAARTLWWQPDLSVALDVADLARWPGMIGPRRVEPHTGPMHW